MFYEFNDENTESACMLEIIQYNIIQYNIT